MVARRPRRLGRARLRPARLRAGGAGRRRPAARGRDRPRAATSRPCIIPRLPAHLLGGRHADGRPAPRLRPDALHGARRGGLPRARRHVRRARRARLASGCAARRVDAGGAELRALAGPALRRARSSRSRSRSSRRSCAQATSRRSARASTRPTSTATATPHPTSRSRWSTCAWSPSGARERPELPAVPRRRRGRAPRPPTGLVRRSDRAGRLPGVRPRAAARSATWSKARR